ncbi:putative HTLV-1-related endogenous sequence [Lutra lutra]|uniref:putative HTLV-1-related endogenous sequence n=1 Tax=Lutra lutra TaxID=9657 RepID=UPI001FD58284|nr:putative HTLV-1-related endogenous sequence [Lutra lutra]
MPPRALGPPREPLTCRTRSRTHTPARRLQDPSPPSRVWTSEAARATAPQRSGANGAPPLRAGPDPPEQRRPRASTEPGAQQRERRGTYCASAGRLPRPLSPRRLRRRGRRGRRQQPASGSRWGRGRGSGGIRPGGPQRAVRADTAPRGGAARGERCHSCRPHHTPCPPRARWGPGARAPRRAQSGERGAEARSAERRAGLAAQSRG